VATLVLAVLVVPGVLPVVTAAGQQLQWLFGAA
jgi:hypothetical protein